MDDEQRDHMNIDCCACKMAWAVIPALLTVGDEQWAVGLCQECHDAQNWEPQEVNDER